MILQGAGDDLGSRGRAAVDQYHQRLAVEGVTGCGRVLHVGIAHAPLGVDDQAVVEEGVGYAHRAVEHAAGVVAQVEHQALKAFLVLQLADGLEQVGGGAGLEAGDAHIAEPGFQRAALDALGADDLAGDGHLDGFRLAFAHDGELDVGAGLAAHQLDGIVERQALHRLVVDADDQVAGLDAGAGGRGVVDGRYHLDQSAFHRHLDAETAELAGGADAQFLELLGAEVGRMGVETGQHAADAVLEQFLVLYRFDIVLLDAGHDIGEGLQLLVGDALGLLLLVLQRKHAVADGQGQADQHAGNEQGGRPQVLEHGILLLNQSAIVAQTDSFDPMGDEMFTPGLVQGRLRNQLRLRHQREGLSGLPLRRISK